MGQSTENLDTYCSFVNSTTGNEKALRLSEMTEIFSVFKTYQEQFITLFTNIAINSQDEKIKYYTNSEITDIYQFIKDNEDIAVSLQWDPNNQNQELKVIGEIKLLTDLFMTNMFWSSEIMRKQIDIYFENCCYYQNHDKANIDVPGVDPDLYFENNINDINCSKNNNMFYVYQTKDLYNNSLIFTI